MKGLVSSVLGRVLLLSSNGERIGVFRCRVVLWVYTVDAIPQQHLSATFTVPPRHKATLASLFSQTPRRRADGEAVSERPAKKSLLLPPLTDRRPDRH
ncbi:hypothetical protein E2C01_094068 [Portunus trituberculatus]|uniref:Uncharacterized protein n=1 Tax=Portunus trituberculatus TaxID=210409 RepID=A0A5B7K0H1_PORTR|nr:hypothetical protein [Portunus trituberculatus]